MQKLKTYNLKLTTFHLYLFFVRFTIVAFRTSPSRLVRLTGLLLNLRENSPCVKDVKPSREGVTFPSRGRNSLSRVGC